MSNESNKIVYKIMVFGDSDTEKKIIFKKLNSGVFLEKSISTFGMDRRTLTFIINTEEGEKEIDLQLWITAGQERFRSLTMSYFKSNQGILLMYDITKKESFENINNVIEFIKEDPENENNLLIFLIGCNLDLTLSNPNCREITSEYAEDFCKEYNIFWGGEYNLKDCTEEQIKDMLKKYIIEIYKKIGVNILRKDITKNESKSKKNKCKIY